MATTIGLDIGSTAVRAAQVSTGRGLPKLERLGQVLLPAGAVRDGEIEDPEAVAEAIRTLWSTYKLKGKKVALGLANQQVVVRQMDLPSLPENELRESLDFQVQDTIPIPTDQAVLDFVVLDEYEGPEGEPLTRILLVAAQRTMVDSLVDVAQRAKLEPTLLDLDAFAVLRSMGGSEFIGGEGAELLIDVGGSVTNLIVHENGRPLFVRILLMGGDDITSTLTASLGLSFEQAEQLKAQHGYHDDPQDDVGTLISERATRFVDEIRGSIDYYHAQVEAIPVRRAMLAGGGSLLPRLADQLSDALGVEVTRGRPTAELETDKAPTAPGELDEAEPFLAVAIGLAMGAAE
ncbi:type IV pilus assembly protein PilM [Egibacter rhizosphaerae]|uniref:Type IV pilus assembly protein PilM n=1 Tax=Egibacter rhizosphaerae TaxID=1670831 RepID=A0A411YJY9_9ACTN|nr:type IV pilus assembly protein PilM [Egibacter rhizosphaerae]QBI21522.1 type IV pilus assembly protein PilM [Egibacter rhizosphaerae]